MKRSKPSRKTSGVRERRPRLRGTGGMLGIRLACDRFLATRGLTPGITDSVTWNQQFIEDSTTP